MSEPSKPTRGVGWVFLFALRREAKPFRRRCGHTRDILQIRTPCPTWAYSYGGKKFLVLVTGMGTDRASAAARWVWDHFRPRLVVACGFTGALSPKFEVGDVLVASEVVEPDEDGMHWRTAVPTELGDLPVGRVVTVRELMGRPSAKRSLARKTAAVAVDMESAAIAEVCQEKRIPCAVVRAISDTADTMLSDRLVTMVSGGRVSPWRVLINVVRSPRLVLELWRLARDTRIAARALAATLQRLL
jgi:adenosylhomocysteine nucleosidase